MNVSQLLALEPIVTWIKVEKPTFDLVGVVLGSFWLAGILLVLALGLGLLLGAALLRSRRRAAETPIESVSLRLDTRS
jgi:hypothetical protein